MFDRKGRLLQANHKALKHCKGLLGFHDFTMWNLFELGLYGSEDTRLAEYQQAMETVFDKQQTFRCQQQRNSRKDTGQPKWVVRAAASGLPCVHGQWHGSVGDVTVACVSCPAGTGDVAHVGPGHRAAGSAGARRCDRSA